MTSQGKTIGLVLRVRDYQERDRWVSVLTAEEGRQDFLAKGVRTLTSRRSAALQPGCLIRCSWVATGETRLLTETVLEETLVSDEVSLGLLRDVSAIFEIVFHISLENQDQAELLDHTAQLLRYLKKHPKNYNRGRVRQTLLEMLYIQGIATPEEVHAQSAVQVFESVLGRSVKSFSFFST
jgi:DNA repair protein RecO